jgi:hypothetical protein
MSGAGTGLTTKQERECGRLSEGQPKHEFVESPGGKSMSATTSVPSIRISATAVVVGSR